MCQRRAKSPPCDRLCKKSRHSPPLCVAPRQLRDMKQLCAATADAKAEPGATRGLYCEMAEHVALSRQALAQR
eukprot:4126490-Prymnesium_polylepis.1